MAKYIEEQEILWRMTNALDEQDTYLPIHFREMVIDECNASDVIERSKIDKAIDEIDFLRQHRAKYITEDNKICIDSGEVIKILKNIND